VSKHLTSEGERPKVKDESRNLRPDKVNGLSRRQECTSADHLLGPGSLVGTASDMIFFLGNMRRMRCPDEP
jgi:hypothetical protein